MSEQDTMVYVHIRPGEEGKTSKPVGTIAIDKRDGYVGWSTQNPSDQWSRVMGRSIAAGRSKKGYVLVETNLDRDHTVLQAINKLLDVSDELRLSRRFMRALSDTAYRLEHSIHIRTQKKIGVK